MTTDRDPTLETLFANANQALAGEVFAAQVMSQIDKLRRGAVIGWICVLLVLITFTWLLATSLQDAADLLTGIFPLSLIDLDNRWLARILSPVNSVAGLIALGVLSLRTAYRKIFT